MATDYLSGADPANPRCSSVFADLRDLPPLLIQVAEDEILFDDAARIRDAARGPPASTRLFSRGRMESRYDPSTYPRAYPSPRSRSKTWPPS
jgi:acetyl esterase/lipase